MEIIVAVLCVLLLATLLKYFGNALLLLVSFILTPFYATFQLITGRASNKTHAIIISLSGLLVILFGVLVAVTA
jgi:hypothetical protein